ncbi:hypothetical protein [Antarcticirhabdus aurantiaca]|uniref:Uncharacterized protein n=1 Tax=Antarcticirhabdus aurantiaca TaxID=2606717 RepID=A0ACD4NWY1_9HYPH|nr:hypothetical protein [Antarcticirhabdus aurantiaca]WAJ31280.1 hypothetical protein OXU80_14200 [Jeongeuplla avenae]
MSDLIYAAPVGAGNRQNYVFGDVVNPEPPHCTSAGLQALLDALPESGDVLDLDQAVAIVSRHHSAPYLQIVVGMNRGLLAADYIEAPWIDREVVIRRV